jgi:flagellar motor component MotA
MLFMEYLNGFSADIINLDGKTLTHIAWIGAIILTLVFLLLWWKKPRKASVNWIIGLFFLSEIILFLWVFRTENLASNIIWVIGTFILGLFGSRLLWKEYGKDKRYGREILSYIPNIWTSLGILGTFLSIVISLWNEDNYSDIKNLVSQIVPAFTTSVIGIIGAIFSSVLIKIELAKQDKNDESPNDTPEKNLRGILEATQTQNGLLSEHNQKIVETLSNQSKILTTFVNNFTSNLETVLEGVKASLERIGELQLDKSSNILAELSEKLNKKGTELIETHTTNTTKVLEANREQLESVSIEMVNTIEDLKSQMSASITKTTEKIQETYDFVNGKASQLVANYYQSAVAYKGAIQNAHDWNGKIESLLNTINTSIENQEATNTNVMQTLDTMKTRQENINNLVARIQEMSAAIDALKELEIQLNRLGQ